MMHDAFISYNHGADYALARALEEGMEKLAKPLLSLRAIDVFRDETGLAANSDLWKGIIDHLTSTKWLVVLACPEWAKSYWCLREAMWWLDNQSADRVLIVLIGGELVWDRARSDFDWSLTTALGKELSGRFREEPLYVDLRWARGQDGLTLRNLAFRDAVLNLSATIRGVPKDRLDGADVRQLRRNRRLVRAGVTAIAIFGMVAVWQAIVAMEQRDEALRQAQIARSRELAAASRLESRNADLAMFLAANAFRTSPTSEALVALRGALLGSPLRMILLGHSKGLTDASFSPDGHWALTASIDGTARLWDANTGKVLKHLSGDSASASFSPKGTYIVTSSEDGAVRVWRSRSGDLVCTLKHTRGVRGADFSPDENRLVTTGLDKTVVIWDVMSCSRSVELAHPQGAAQVSFSSDGLKILSAGFDETTRVWDAGNGTLLATLWHRFSNFAVFSPDGSKVVTAGLDNSPTLWDIAGPNPVAKSLGYFQLGGTRASFCADGKLIAVAGVQPAVRIFDAQTGQPIAEWSEAAADLDPTDAGNPGLTLVAFGPDCSQVLTQVGTTIRLWDVASRTRIALFRGHTESVRSAVLSPDGLRVISSSFDGTARIWQAGDTRTIAQLGEVSGPLEHSVFSFDGRWLAAATRENGVRLWQMDNPEQPRVLRSGTRMFQTVAISTDKNRIVAQTTPYAQLWDTVSGEALVTLRPEVTVDAINFPQFSPDSSRIIAGSATSARIWRTDNGKNVLELNGHTNAIMHAVFSPDGKRAVTASKDNTARIWDTESGQNLHTLAGHGDTVSFAGYSPDGRRVVTASWDYTARVWDAESGLSQAVLVGHSRPLSYAGFSADGLWVVTLSDDQTARIWDAATGQELSRFWSSTEGLLATTFLPDNDGVAVLTRSGKLMVLRCELCTTPDVLLRLASERVSRQPTPDEARRYHLDSYP